MKDDASNEQIDKFLSFIRNSVTAPNGIIFPDRKKNLISLAKWGISIAEQKEIIKNLKFNNYFSGPDDEWNNNFPPGEIWVFKKKIRCTNFYIKFKKEKDGEKFILKCLSFHEDEY